MAPHRLIGPTFLPLEIQLSVKLTNLVETCRTDPWYESKDSATSSTRSLPPHSSFHFLATCHAICHLSFIKGSLGHQKGPKPPTICPHIIVPCHHLEPCNLSTTSTYLYMFFHVMLGSAWMQPMSPSTQCLPLILCEHFLWIGWSSKCLGTCHQILLTRGCDWWPFRPTTHYSSPIGM